MHRIISGDVLRFAQHYHGPKFHAVLCDPPYELGFMGKSWDSRGVSFRAETWLAIRSLLKPGAHLLAFGGTRTFHRIACAIEDAGFEIRDTLGWLYGSGFPKSHDVSKAIDREAGAEREVVGYANYVSGHGVNSVSLPAGRPKITSPATEASRAWQGYGTALKPAWEPVIVARNPLLGTVAQNAMEHGAGALNVDGGRIQGDSWIRSDGGVTGLTTVYSGGEKRRIQQQSSMLGRWPANIIHDGSDDIAEVMSDAHRFFYCAKASKRERGEGNHHPTVKPLALTEYLARLILPATVVGERRILVPFAGSGSECIGAMLAGWETIIGVEREDEYVRIARARMEYHGKKPD